MKRQKRRSGNSPRPGAAAVDDPVRLAERQHIVAVLHKWGIHSVGQLAALNKDDLSRRLGPEAVRLWERATGRATRLLNLVQPPEVFEETFEFEHEIETSEPLLFMLRRFLQQFSVQLGSLYLVAKTLKLRIFFADKQHYEHQFQIPEPTANVEVLFRMLHTHLENFTSEAPIVGVALEAEAARAAQQQFGLFETPLRDPGQLGETLARLSALLGSDRVGSPVLEETHRPDAFRMESFSWQLAEGPVPPAEPPNYALRRFRPDVPADVIAPKRAPIQIRAAGIDEVIAARRGPYTASGNWWDDESWRRVEWDVELENGTLCRCHEHEHGWVVDGIYD